jgi:hypothetical protein
MISFKPIESYYTNDDNAVIVRTAELAAAGKRCQAELAELDSAIANQDKIGPTLDDQVQNLIAGIDVPRPPPLSAKRIELQYKIRDIEQALDFMARKERQVIIKAGARLAKDIKPQVDIAEKELVDALVIAHAKHLVCFQAKRKLINEGIGLHGLLGSNVDDVLGIPVDKCSALHDFFYAAVRAGNLKTVPESLR